MIRLNNLIVQYRMGADVLTVLDIPAWEVEEGAQVAISGSSGSGKSTLLHVLAGLLAPTSGEVRVCGHELVGLSEAARDAFRAQSISVIFQNFNLMQGYTALENVLMGMTFSPTRADRAVRTTCWRPWGWRIGAGTIPRRCRSGSSNAWPLRARW